jgi:hypothetical protein
MVIVIIVMVIAFIGLIFTTKADARIQKKNPPKPGAIPAWENFFYVVIGIIVMGAMIGLVRYVTE